MNAFRFAAVPLLFASLASAAPAPGAPSLAKLEATVRFAAQLASRTLAMIDRRTAPESDVIERASVVLVLTLDGYADEPLPPFSDSYERRFLRRLEAKEVFWKAAEEALGAERDRVKAERDAALSPADLGAASGAGVLQARALKLEQELAVVASIRADLAADRAFLAAADMSDNAALAGEAARKRAAFAALASAGAPLLAGPR